MQFKIHNGTYIEVDDRENIITQNDKKNAFNQVKEDNNGYSSETNVGCSESVHLYGRLLDTIVDEEVGDLGTLITLQLNDLAHLFVFDEGAVASKLLLEGFEELLRVVLLGQALQSGQCLPSISLLNTNVDVICLRSNVLVVSKRVTLVSEGIESV